MIKTSTPELAFESPITAENLSQHASEASEAPSWRCIQNILNFSKNLEVKDSEYLGKLDFIRS